MDITNRKPLYISGHINANKVRKHERRIESFQVTALVFCNCALSTPSFRSLILRRFDDSIIELALTGLALNCDERWKLIFETLQLNPQITTLQLRECNLTKTQLLWLLRNLMTTSVTRLVFTDRAITQDGLGPHLYGILMSKPTHWTALELRHPWADHATPFSLSEYTDLLQFPQLQFLDVNPSKWSEDEEEQRHFLSALASSTLTDLSLRTCRTLSMDNLSALLNAIIQMPKLRRLTIDCVLVSVAIFPFLLQQGLEELIVRDGVEIVSKAQLQMIHQNVRYPMKKFECYWGWQDSQEFNAIQHKIHFFGSKVVRTVTILCSASEVPRLVTKAPIRRLPGEMFRLVKQMLY